MLKYGNRDFRNLQEQVYANMKNIQDIINGSNIIADFKTVNVIGQVDSFSDLPDADTYDGNWGDAFLVGDEEDSKLYVFTKAYEEENAPQWFDVGHFPVPGPTGPQGIQGPEGEPGTDWYVGTDIVHQLGQGTVITSYATSYPNLKVDDFYLIKSTYTSGLVTFKAGDVYQVTGLVGGTAYVVKRLSIEGPQGETGAAGADGTMWYTGVYSAINFDISGNYYYLQVASYPNIKAGDYFLATSSGTVLPAKSVAAGDYFVVTSVSADTGRATINSTAAGSLKGPQGPTGASGGLWYSGASGIMFSNAQYIVYNVGLPDLKIGDLYLVTSTYQSGGITINKGDVFKVTGQSTAISFTCTKLANIQGPQGEQGPEGEIDAEDLANYIEGQNCISVAYDEDDNMVYAKLQYASPLELDSNSKLTVNQYKVFSSAIVFSALIGTNLNYTTKINASNFMTLPIVYQLTVGTTVTSVALYPKSYELNVGSATSTIKAEGYDSSNNKYALSWEFVGSGIYNITVTTPTP